jgi:elongation factor 1-beta
MGIALIKLRIMPISVETDLEELKQIAKEIIEQEKGVNCNFEEQAIAFGLKAIIAGFSLDEEYELELIEEKLRKREEINSVEVSDMRRAFG